jgi:Flp pilus assembly protein CpaB
MSSKKILLIGAGVVGAGVLAYLYLNKSQAAQDAQAAAQLLPSSAPGSSATPTGTVAKPSCPYPAGTLLRAGSDSKVYLVNDQCQRQWITSRSKFDALGLKMDQVYSVSNELINMVPRGADLSGLRGLSGFAMT